MEEVAAEQIRDLMVDFSERPNQRAEHVHSHASAEEFSRYRRAMGQIRPQSSPKSW